MTIALPESPPDQLVVAAVREHWDQLGKPMLLSQLGSRIPREESTRIKEQFGSLVSYIRRELSDDITVLQSKENPTIIGAIPANAVDDEFLGADILLSRSVHQPGATFPRFHPAFWAAFIKDLEPEAHRHVSVGPPPRFRDLGSDEEPEDTLEIARDYIVGTDDDVAAVHKSINKWIRANGLREETFLAESTTIAEDLPSDDLLGRLVGSLTQDELKRMSIPLDIVSKLRRRAV